MMRSECLFLGVMILSGNWGLAAETSSVTLLYTSDLAARYAPVNMLEDYQAGWARLASVVESIREENSPVLLLDPGGYLNPDQILCQEETAAWIVPMLNALRYDAMGVGPSELQWGSQGAFERLRHANFPIVCTNLVFAETGKPLFWQHWVIQHDNLRIAVLSVIDERVKDSLVGMQIPDVRVLPPIEALRDPIKRLRPIVNLLIVLSTMPDEANRDLARALPAIDVIVGGTRHSQPLDPMTVGQTIVLHAGSGANQLGRLDMQLGNPPGRKTWQHRMLSVGPDVPPYDPVQHRVEEAIIAEQVIRSEVLGRITEPLRHRPGLDSPLGNWLADVIRDTTGAEVAFHNSRAIRSEELRGFVTVGDLFDLTDYVTLVTLELTGRQIRRILEHNLREQSDPLYVSGLTYTYEADRVEQVLVGSQPLRPNRIYRVATNHRVIALADRYFGFAVSSFQNTQRCLYEALVAKLRREGDFGIDRSPRAFSERR